MTHITVISKRRSKIGEGPVWDHRINKLVYVDIFEGIISRLDPETQEEDIYQFANDCVTLVLPFENDPNKLVISRNKQLYYLDWNTKELSLCAEVEPGSSTRFNDGKCDNKGRLWAGTMSLETSPMVFSDDKGSLYCMRAPNCLTKHEEGVRISNGLAWDKANKKMYFIDSLPRKIYAFDYDAELGTIRNRQTLVDFNSNPTFSDFGLPDGMTIDADDKLWVACINGSRVLCIDPNTGALLRTICFPCQNITSCAWGGPNYDILYVTSGWLGLSDCEKAEQPTAGAVFKVTGLGVKGLPPSFYNNN